VTDLDGDELAAAETRREPQQKDRSIPQAPWILTTCRGHRQHVLTTQRRLRDLTTSQLAANAAHDPTHDGIVSR
jgi:hypothetical protein